MQFLALLEGWEEQPYFWWGHGTGTSKVVRSVEQPWAYELTYVALLFHTGIIGIFLYASGIAWMYWKGIQMIRTGLVLGMYMVPLPVAKSCFLIANGTNPYLEKYDYLWIVFLPPAYINYNLIHRQPIEPQHAADS